MTAVFDATVQGRRGPRGPSGPKGDNGAMVGMTIYSIVH